MLKGFTTSICPTGRRLLPLRQHYDFRGFYLAPALRRLNTHERRAPEVA
jgi:hypothetical protein